MLACIVPGVQGRIQSFGLRRSLAGALRVRGQSPGGVWGQNPQKPEECLRHEAEKTIYEEKNKSTRTDIV